MKRNFSSYSLQIFFLLQCCVSSLQCSCVLLLLLQLQVAMAIPELFVGFTCCTTMYEALIFLFLFSFLAWVAGFSSKWKRRKRLLTVLLVVWFDTTRKLGLRVLPCHRRKVSVMEEIKVLDELSHAEMKDLEYHLDSIRAKVETGFQEIEIWEKKIEVAEAHEAANFRTKAEELKGEVEQKAKELGLLVKQVESCVSELKFKEKELVDVRKLVEDCSKELSLTRRDSAEMQEFLKKTQREIESKERQLGQTNAELRWLHRETCAKKQNVGKVQNAIRECEEEIGRKTSDLEMVAIKVNECQKLCSKEELQDSRHKLLELWSSELESKEKELDAVRERIEGCNLELESKQREVESLNNLIKDSSEQLDLKNKELGEIKKLIEEQTEELKHKLIHCDSIKSLIGKHVKELLAKDKERREMFESIQRRSLEIESRGKELAKIEDSLQNLSEKLQSKENKLDSAEKRLKQCIAELGLREKELGLVKREFNSLQLCINERQEQIEVGEKEKQCLENSVEKINSKLRAKQDELDPVQKSVMECSHKLEAKKKQHDEIQTSVKDLSHELKSKESKLHSTMIEIQEKLKEFESQEKQYNSLKASLDKREEELKLKEKQFDVRVKEFEQYATHFASLSGQQNIAVFESEQAYQLPQNEHDIMRHEVPAFLKHNEVSTVLRSRPDPAEFILDLLRGAIKRNHQQSEIGLEESLVKNCVILLEELLQVPREIKPQLQSEALKLAIEWKGKMKTENPNHLEALGFLEILVAYNLVHSFNRVEIANLSWSIAHYKHAPQLFHFLGFSSAVHNIVLRLIDQEKYIPAVRFILGFKLTDKFHPESILRKEINNLIGTQTERRDVAKMRAILELIAEYKLKMELPGDLMTKFMLQPRDQNVAAGSFIPVQEPSSTSTVRMQAQPQHAATRFPGQGHQISPITLPRPQTPGAFHHRVGSSPSLSQTPQCVGDKRPRIDAQAASWSHRSG